MSPVKPADVLPLIVKDNDSWCTIFKKVLQTGYLYYKFVRYMVKEDRSLADGFVADVCALDCSEDSTT